MCINFVNVSLKLGSRMLFDNINTSINKGFNLIYAKSGSGKTSLLKLINMLYTPSSGRILFNKNSIDKYKPNRWRSICMLTSQTASLMDSSVEDNLTLPFSFKAHKNKNINLPLMYELLETFELDKHILSEPSIRLSGGEMQRISIIRTILLQPDIFLFDEPTSALDEHTQDRVLSYIKKLSADKICIVCSHAKESFNYCSRSFQIINRTIVND